MLCQTYERAPFDERGRKRNRRRVLQLLSSRLRVEDALRRHPEIREREIRRPMVLTGLPRSGTSALFSLLAADPRRGRCCSGRPSIQSPPWDSRRASPTRATWR